MLVIRLQRTGRKNLPAYRIVVAEKARAVKKHYIDLVGHYLPSQNPKVIEIDQDKVKDWISKGAIPSDTVASLCKHQGMSDMDKYISQKNKKAKRKKEVPEEVAPTPAPAAEAAPIEEPAATVETPAEEPVAAEESVETPPEEEPATEEAPAEETSAEESAPEEENKDEE